MPTVKIIGRFRFHFYSADGREPPHIHVTAPDGEAKFWLQPLSLAFSHGFHNRDLRMVHRLVNENLEEFLEAWHDYFQDQA